MRETISSEMWQQINALYLMITAESRNGAGEDQLLVLVIEDVEVALDVTALCDAVLSAADDVWRGLVPRFG